MPISFPSLFDFMKKNKSEKKKDLFNNNKNVDDTVVPTFLPKNINPVLNKDVKFPDTDDSLKPPQKTGIIGGPIFVNGPISSANYAITSSYILSSTLASYYNTASPWPLNSSSASYTSFISGPMASYSYSASYIDPKLTFPMDYKMNDDIQKKAKRSYIEDTWKNITKSKYEKEKDQIKKDIEKIKMEWPDLKDDTAKRIKGLYDTGAIKDAIADAKADRKKKISYAISGAFQQPTVHPSNRIACDVWIGNPSTKKQIDHIVNTHGVPVMFSMNHSFGV